MVLTVLLTAFLLLGGWGIVNAASPPADQQCSAIGASYLDGIGTHEPAGQTFIPTQSSIVGFSIYVSSSSSNQTSMTANIRLSGIGGAVLGVFAFSVPAGFGGATGDWLPIQFPSGIHLTPGSTYAIDLVDTSGGSAVRWYACSTPYTGGCGYADGQCQATSWTFVEYSGDFSLSLSSKSLVLVQGSSGSVEVTVTSLSSFASPVTLSASGTGGESFSSNPITPAPDGTASSNMSIFVPGDVAAGSYQITVTGVSGPVSHSVTLTLTVVAPGVSDFALTAGPTVVISPGATGTAPVYVTAFDGFNSQVGLAASWQSKAPADVTFSLPSPVTPALGGTATSTLTLTAGAAASTGTYIIAITATSGALTHVTYLNVVVVPAAATTTTMTTTLPDFSISVSSPSVSIIQGLSSSTTIIVASIGGFSSPVTFSGGWVGSAPTGVSFTLPSPITPPPGGAGSSPMAITTTSTSSTGAFLLRVSGSADGIVHSTNVTVQVTSPGPQCIIATAAYGSEVAPEVLVLRNYRDNAVMKTNAGSNFMIAFNAWYYSFSPPIANHIANSWVERAVVRASLYPLIGILALSSTIFAVTATFPELAVLVSGIIASSLLGAVYLGLPLALLRRKVRRLRPGPRSRALERSISLLLLCGIAAVAVGELLGSPVTLMIASVLTVLSSLTLTAAVTSSRIASRTSG
jgi:hypothetical protein